MAKIRKSMCLHEEGSQLFAFLDESGNTGANFIDLRQPVYIVAGWLVPLPFLHKAQRAVASFRQEYYPQAAELHAKRILKSATGAARLLELVDALAEAGCMPIASLVEKRYAVAGKIVETFLDPYYNPLAPKKLGMEAGAELAVHLKQDLAQVFYNLPDTYLRDFAKAYRVPDGRLLDQSMNRLTLALRLVGHNALAQMLEGSRPRLDEIAGDEAWVKDSRGTSSLNFPIFATVLSILEDIGRSIGVRRLHVRHDSSEEFREAFQFVFDRFRSLRHMPSTKEIRYENGRLVFFGLRVVHSFEMVDSHESPLIQAADLLAGALNSYSVLSVTDGSVSPPLLEIASRILPAALFPLQYCSYLGSEQFIKKVFVPAIKHFDASEP
jgi:hypothetical protein